ncbi:MAG: acylphosphatase [Balneola sp.]|nr:acylphosphatase [Balneola sp.]MBE78763.1 acylphosphatase [Balneola sp.]HBX65219.1 acylphosphatase [Balneolaceae bacterium]
MKKHIYISGRVQGVGFRHFTKTNARELGVNGWVKNLNDGRVEAVFEGGEEPVKKLIERCKDGPPSGYVKDMEVNNMNEEDSYSSFEVRF